MWQLFVAQGPTWSGAVCLAGPHCSHGSQLPPAKPGWLLLLLWSHHEHPSSRLPRTFALSVFYPWPSFDWFLLVTQISALNTIFSEPFLTPPSSYPTYSTPPTLTVSTALMTGWYLSRLYICLFLYQNACSHERNVHLIHCSKHSPNPPTVTSDSHLSRHSLNM